MGKVSNTRHLTFLQSRSNVGSQVPCSPNLSAIVKWLRSSESCLTDCNIAVFTSTELIPEYQKALTESFRHVFLLTIVKDLVNHGKQDDRWDPTCHLLIGCNEQDCGHKTTEDTNIGVSKIF